MKRVAVVGGGISGLSTAWELLRQGCDVTLLEKSGRAGGVMGSVRRGAYQFELGPNLVRTTDPGFLEFVNGLDLGDEMLECSGNAAKRYLYYGGKLQLLPSTVKGFLKSELFTATQKIRVLMEPWIRRGDPDHEETVAEFFGRRIGRGITMTWIDIVVSGIYGGNPNRLGIRSAFPELRKMEQEHGSVFRAMKARAAERRVGGDAKAGPLMISFKGGLQALIDRILERLGDRARKGCEVMGLVRLPDGGFRLSIQETGGSTETVDFDNVVMAAPAYTAGILIAPFASEAADLMFDVEYVDMLVIHAGFPEKALPGLPPGFGFLVPRCMRIRTLGWIFSSHLFPDQTPEGRIALTGMLGGSLDPHCLKLSDEQLQHVMLGELALCLGYRKTPAPEIFANVRWKNAIPQYNVGHLRRMQAVRALLAERAPGLILAANWVDGVSVEACVLRGRAAAREILGATKEVAP